MENVARDATTVPSYEGEKLRVLGDLYRILAKSEDTRWTFSLWETRLPRAAAPEGFFPGPASSRATRHFRYLLKTSL